MINNKRRLLAGASMAAVALIVSATGANAKPAHRRTHAAANAGPSQAEQIAELRAQLAELTARLNAQETSQRTLVTQTQAAATQATEAATQATAAQTAVQEATAAVPQQVQTAMAASHGPAKWFDNTSISGRMYFDATSITQNSNGNRQNRSTSFDIKRLYIGVDHKFNDMFSANVTTDTSLISGVGFALYLKKAYLQAHFSDALNFRVGSADLPWIPFVEDIYGFRYVENTLTDRTKFGTSADWGIHAYGKLADGHITYAVAAVDGAGYRNPQRSRTVDIEGRVAANYHDFTVAVGGYTGKLGKDIQSGGVTTPTFHRAERLDALAAYVHGPVRLGVEYFYAKNWNQVTALADDSSSGVSGFGSYEFRPKFKVFGRYDYVEPRRRLSPDLHDHYFNVGVSYTPVSVVELGLVYKRESVDDIPTGFSYAPTNVASAAAFTGAANHGTYDEVGLFGQWRF